MRRFVTEPVQFPAEWSRADPFDPVLIQAELDVQKAWTACSASINLHTRDASIQNLLGKVFEGEALHEDERTTLSVLAKAAVPFLDECSRTVTLAGYEAGISEPGHHSAINWYTWQIAAQAACAQAFVLAEEGKWEPAFDYALLPLRRAQRHPANFLVLHLISLGCQSVAARSLDALAVECPDPRLLRRTLEEMNRLRDRVNHNIMEQGDLADYLGQLRSYRRGGYPADLFPGKPKMHYMSLALEASLDFPQWMVENLPPGDPRRVTYQKMIPGAGSGGPGSGPVSARLGLRGMRTLFPEMLYRLGRPSLQVPRIREQTALALYDLARLRLATRILELEGKGDGTGDEEQVSRLLTEMPVDPFSGASFLRDEAAGVYYSVGPDGGDDRLGEIYDPTNGTISRGDLAGRRLSR